MIADTVRESARRFGDTTAYVTPRGWSVSYRDLDRLTDEVAAGLARRGVGVGDVVGLVFPPGVEYLLCYLGAAKVGAITAGVNEKLADPERDAVLAVAGPRLVLAAPERGGRAAPVEEFATVETPEQCLRALRADADDAPGALPDDPGRPAAIIFTSGTTGTPRGAVYGDRQLRFIADTDVPTWGTGGRTFNGTSCATLGFMTKLCGNLRRGGTQFMMERWSPRAALELVERERMSSVGGVPTQLALMLHLPDFDAFDLSSVATIVVGGAPITPGLADEARARFGAPLITRYACTETGLGLGTAADDPPADAVESVGRPLPGVDLAVLDDDDRPVAPGEVGGVCLRSPAVMSGYWNDPDATRAAFTADGHVRTGDLGWVDERGRLHLVGRSKEMYVRGGYNVYPVEVEAALSDAPGVAAIAIATRPDPTMGEIGVACVVPRDGSAPPTLDEIRAFGADRLARHKLPEAVVVVAALPLTAAEKIDRRALARLADAGAGPA